MILTEFPLVSIIVPAYNAEEYIDRCIESILSQSYENIELIIVNDGSSDGTGKIVEEYSNLDSRIRILDVPNGGVSCARNIGMLQARGKYCQFVDADDMLMADAVRTEVQAAEQCDADIVHFDYSTLSDVDSNSLEYFNVVNVSIDQAVDDFCLNRIENYVWCFFFKREYLKKHNIVFNQKIDFGEDVLFIAQLFKKSCTIIYISKCLYFYRLHSFGTHMTHSFKYGYDDYLVLKSLDRSAISDSKYYMSYRMQILCSAYNILPFKKSTRELLLAKKIKKELYVSFRANHFKHLSSRDVISTSFILVNMNLYDFLRRIIRHFK